jgi:hypothetical protein
LGKGSLSEEQRRFFEELLAYLRDELKARKDPEATEQRVRMFASLAGEAGKARVLEDKRLAEEGFVYLFEEGKRRTKRIEELRPFDVPAVLAEMGLRVAAEVTRLAEGRDDTGGKRGAPEITTDLLDLGEAVTHSADGLDIARVLGIGLHLPTDVLDMDISGPGFAEKVTVPEVAHDLVSVVYSPRVRREEREDFEFLGRQRDELPVSEDLPPQEVYLQPRKL